MLYKLKILSPNSHSSLCLRPSPNSPESNTTKDPELVSQYMGVYEIISSSININKGLSLITGSLIFYKPFIQYLLLHR